MKAVIRGKLISLQAYLKKQKKSQVNNITEKEEQKQAKVSRRKEIIKTRAEMDKIGNKKTIHKINATKS